MYEDVIKELMGRKRYRHSINVSKCAQNLADIYGVNKEKAKIAGILHDITKEFNETEQMKVVNDFNIKLSELEISEKKLLHQITGKTYIEYIIGIKDEDILNAVRYHTTGRQGMSDLEKILYIADAISEERAYEGVNKIRKLAKKDMDYTVLKILSDTIRNLVNIDKPIHLDTVYAYNEIAFKLKNKKEYK